VHTEEKLQLGLYFPLKDLMHREISVRSFKFAQVNVNIPLTCEEYVYNGRGIWGVCCVIWVWFVSELLAHGLVSCTEGPCGEPVPLPLD
jgi:hypothetical protein